MTNDRRQFLGVAAVGLTGLWPAASRADDPKQDDEGVSAPEDLMREHGVIRRVMFVYDEGVRRLEAREDVPPEVFRRAAELVRRFVEEYHEKLEEQFVFPEFEKRQHPLGKMTAILRRQHAAGRAVTDTIVRLSEPAAYRLDKARKQLAEAARSFTRMYPARRP